VTMSFRGGGRRRNLKNLERGASSGKNEGGDEQGGKLVIMKGLGPSQGYQYLQGKGAADHIGGGELSTSKGWKRR